jgi:hypothetical protein
MRSHLSKPNLLLMPELMLKEIGKGIEYILLIIKNGKFWG